MRIVLLTFLAFLWLNTNSMADNNAKDFKLIYVFDPLCGWCFGFSPVIEEFAMSHPEIDIQVVSGGMVVGDGVGPIGEVAPYIAQAYKDVEKATGVKFGKKFLDGTLKDGKAIFTSVPPSKAMAVVNRRKPEKAVEFSGMLHRSIYQDGWQPTDLDLYKELADSVDINSDEFLEEMESPKNIARMQEDFELSSQLGVTGFPCVFMKGSKGIILISEGYINRDTLEAGYKTALEILHK